MTRKRSRLEGFGCFVITMEEVTGKHIRDYLFKNSIKSSKFFENLAIDYLIMLGEIKNREELGAEIERYKY